MRLAFLIPPIMLLAACGQEKKATDETEVSVDADSGKLKINGEGVNIDLDIPDLGDMELGSDFEIDGVKLYPGSKITTMDVKANDKNGASDAMVKFGFTAPAAPAQAADWMAGEFAKKGVKITRTGDTLAGTAKDGDTFRISFAPDGTKAKGEALIVSK